MESGASPPESRDEAWILVTLLFPDPTMATARLPLVFQLHAPIHLFCLFVCFCLSHFGLGFLIFATDMLSVLCEFLPEHCIRVG